MIATDELRRILDERGVKWESGLPTETIVREPYNALYVERPDGRMHVYFRSYLTPEQAIAATLGPCNDSCNCSNSERTGTCKADETDVIKCWVKCKDEPSSERMELIHVMECSACGGTYEHVNGGYEFCPRCGRRIEEVDE